MEPRRPPPAEARAAATVASGNLIKPLQHRMPPRLPQRRRQPAPRRRPRLQRSPRQRGRLRYRSPRPRTLPATVPIRPARPRSARTELIRSPSTAPARARIMGEWPNGGPPPDPRACGVGPARREGLAEGVGVVLGHACGTESRTVAKLPWARGRQLHGGRITCATSPSTRARHWPAVWVGRVRWGACRPPASDPATARCRPVRKAPAVFFSARRPPGIRREIFQ